MRFIDVPFRTPAPREADSQKRHRLYIGRKLSILTHTTNIVSLPSRRAFGRYCRGNAEGCSSRHLDMTQVNEGVTRNFQIRNERRHRRKRRRRRSTCRKRTGSRGTDKVVGEANKIAELPNVVHHWAISAYGKLL